MTKQALLKERVRSTLQALGAPADLVERRKLPIHPDAERLTPVGVGTDGRDKFLTPAAATAWLSMREAASKDGVELLLVSAFRSFDFQLALIRNKLSKGRAIEEILTVNAPPGCSEHHTGRAIDIGDSATPPLEEDFENTQAFAWLGANAGGFGFSLSYPRGNRHGYLYEPWHWCYGKR